MSIDYAKSTPLSCSLPPVLSQDGMTLPVALLLVCLLSTCVSPLYWWQQLRTQRQSSAVDPICIFKFSFSLLIRACGWMGCKELKIQELATVLKSSLATRPCSAFLKWAQKVYQGGSFGNTCLVPVWKGMNPFVSSAELPKSHYLLHHTLDLVLTPSSLERHQGRSGERELNPPECKTFSEEEGFAGSRVLYPHGLLGWNFESNRLQKYSFGFWKLCATPPVMFPSLSPDGPGMFYRKQIKGMKNNWGGLGAGSVVGQNAWGGKAW